MKFHLSHLFLLVTGICTTLGAYSLGRDHGRHLGYQEREDHFNSILQANASYPGTWLQIGHLIHEYPDTSITAQEAAKTEALWQEYRKEIKPGMLWSEIDWKSLR